MTKAINSNTIDEQVCLRSVALKYYADCGAGIGRVTKHLLLDRFETVDIVEQSPRLLEEAPAYVGRDKDRIECVCIGLQVNLVDIHGKVWALGLATFPEGRERLEVLCRNMKAVCTSENPTRLTSILIVAFCCETRFHCI